MGQFRRLEKGENYNYPKKKALLLWNRLKEYTDILKIWLVNIKYGKSWKNIYALKKPCCYYIYFCSHKNWRDSLIHYHIRIWISQIDVLIRCTTFRKIIIRDFVVKFVRLAISTNDLIFLLSTLSGRLK